MIRLMFWAFVAGVFLMASPLLVVAISLGWIIANRKRVFG